MKKSIILVLLFLLIGISACTPEDTTEVINQSDVDYVNELIDLIPEEITENDSELIETIKIAYEGLNDAEKELIINYDRFVYAETIIRNIEEEKRKLEEAEEEIKDLLIEMEDELDEIIPDEVSDNIALPMEFIKEEGKVIVLWSSSDYLTFSNTGVVIPGREDIEVEIAAELKFIPNDPNMPKDITHIFTQKVVVKGIQFDSLPKSNLTFAYAYKGSGFTDEAIETIDVVNHAFSSIVNGVVSVGSTGRQELLELRKKGVRVSLCIGGYGEGAIPFSEAASTVLGRIELANSIVKAIEDYHFDGVDIDWEYPGFYAAPGISDYQDRRNYTLFIAELRRQVKEANEDYLVTAAVPGGPFTSQRYEIGNLNSYLDYYLLMTYDLHNQDLATHHTALYPSSYTINGCSIDETIDLYVSRGASRNKLVIGAAFYGRSFELDNQGTPFPQAPAEYRSSIDYKKIAANYLTKLESGTVKRFWDDQAKAPYLYNEDTNIFISYDDAESIKYKIEYLKNEGLAGIMFWEFTQDNGELLSAIHENMK